MNYPARSVRIPLLLTLVGVLALVVLAHSALTRVAAAPEDAPFGPEDTGGPDTFGYTFRDSAEPNGPVFSWVNISGTGTALDLTTGSGDNRHGPLPLGFTFNYYGTDYTDVWFGADGWLTVGAADPGTNDNSNDCPLPSQNGNENVIGGIWDNLNAAMTTPNGNGYYQAFPAGSCPYGGYPGACFVAQWQGTYYSQLPIPPYDPTTFEIILFDDNDILVQIQEAGDRAGSGSTTGIENVNATDGLTYACNEAASLADNSAIQFYYPVFATRFDYSYKQGPPLSQTGNNLNYTVVISNSGNMNSTNTVMTDTIPAGTTYVPSSLSCVGGSTTECVYDSIENEIRWQGGVNQGSSVTVSYAVAPTNGVCGDVISNEAVISDPDAAATTILLPSETILASAFTLYNLEADNGGFTPTNDWQYGIPTWPVGLHAHSGNRLWATILDGYYNNLGTSSTLTKNISLAGLPNNAKLVWWQYLKTNNNLFDVGTVRLNGNEIYNSAGQDELVWTRHTESLTPYVGGNLNLAFDFFSTLSINNDGWYVDDIGVYYCLPQPTPNLNLSTKSTLPIGVTGKTLTYDITLDNFSTVSAPNTSVVDPIPAGTTYVPGSATNGAVYNAGQNRIEWTGSVPANGQVTLNYAVTINAAPGTTITNTATITQPSLSQPVIVEATTDVVTNQTATYPSCTNFESGARPAYMYTEVTTANNSTGRARVTNVYPHLGTFGFDLDTDDPGGNGAGTTRQAGIIVANLLGAPELSLNFWVRAHADEDNPEDGIFISDDGGQTYFKIYDPPAGDWVPYQNVFVNLTDAIAAANMSFTETFLIKFQSVDNYAIAEPPFTSDGYSYDDICLEAVVPQGEITPTSLSSTQLNNVVVTQTLTINSIGTDVLDWNFTEAPTTCTAPATVSWLSVSPSSGATAASSSTDVTVSIDSNGIPLGTNLSANLCFNSTDPNDPVIQIPVSLTVTSPPDIFVTPNTVTATVYLSQTTHVTFTITNLGFNPLEWYSLEESAFGPEQNPAGTGVLIYGPDGTTDQLVAFNSSLSNPLYPVGPVGGDYAAADILPTDIQHLLAIRSTNALTRISLVDGSTTTLGNLPPPANFFWSGMAVDPVTGVVYASITNCSNTSRLFTIDPVAVTATEIGIITNGSCVTDIAINASGQMYGVDEFADRLIRINKDTGVSKIVEPLGFNAANGQGPDFDEASGVLYLAALRSGPLADLRTVNTNTGATTVIGPLTIGGSNLRLGDIAIVGGTSCSPGSISWASITPTGGTVAPNSSVPVVVTMSAVGLGVGTYNGTLCILSVDSNEPEVTVTLQLTVEEEPPPPPDELYIFLPFMRN